MGNDNRPPPEPLLTTGQVAELFCVNRATVARWAQAGRIPCIKTPGGTRRYREADVRAFLNGSGR